METAWFFLKTFSLRMAKQGDLNRFLRTDLSAPAAAPAILTHHRLPVLEAHGPDETTLYADSTTIAGIPHPDFKAFYFLEPRCGLFRPESRAFRWWDKASSTEASRPRAGSISLAPSPRKRHPISGEKRRQPSRDRQRHRWRMNR